jgi:hypothetical protein
MGTRADFYAGKGKDAEWLGSIAWDGYETAEAIDAATTEADYRSAVSAFLASRDDATLPEQGWPWPWDNSGTTDCSYWFFDGKVWEESGKRYIVRGSMPEDEDEQEAHIEKGEVINFPDMSERKSVTFGERSGLIVLGG